jgi:hypothetical protein
MNTFCEHHKNSIKFAHRCFDRILLNGLIQPFQQPERVIGFFNAYREGLRVTRNLLAKIFFVINKDRQIPVEVVNFALLNWKASSEVMGVTRAGNPLAEKSATALVPSLTVAKMPLNLIITPFLRKCQGSLKTSHFLEQKTAPRNYPDAGPMGHVELSNVLKVSLQETVCTLDDRAAGPGDVVARELIDRETVGRNLLLAKPAISTPGPAEASALYHKFLIWLSSNMSAKLLERLAIGKGIGTRHIRFKRYAALVKQNRPFRLNNTPKLCIYLVSLRATIAFAGSRSQSDFRELRCLDNFDFSFNPGVNRA